MPQFFQDREESKSSCQRPNCPNQQRQERKQSNPQDCLSGEIPLLHYTTSVRHNKGDRYKKEKTPDNKEMKWPGGYIVNQAEALNLSLNPKVEGQV